MPALTLLAAYLLGSVSFGVLYSRWRGADIRLQDAPGGSGVYRQYGAAAGALVVALDLLKGALAAGLALWLAPAWTPLAIAAVVVGHNYPLFFGFDGGAGLAPLIGALLVAAPITLLGALLSGALFGALYRLTLQRRLGFNVVPAAAAVALPVGLICAWRFGGALDLLAGALALAVRAAQLLRKP